MSSSTAISVRSSSTNWPLVVCLLTFLSTGIAMSALSLPYGGLVLVLLVAVPFIGLACRNPDWIVAATLFAIFINAPVVAVKFHGVPKVIGMIGPPTALLLVWFLQVVFRSEPVLFPKPLRWGLVFLGVEVISAALCRYPGIAMDVLQSHIMEGFGLFILVCNVIRTRQALKMGLLAVMLAGAALGGLSLWQQVTHTHHQEYGGFAQIPVEAKGFQVGTEAVQQRATGSLGEKNRYAQNLLMLLPMAILPLFSRGTSVWKLVYLLLAGLIAVGCMLTFSRGAAVGFVMLVAAMTLMGYVRVQHLTFLGVASLILVMAFPQMIQRMDAVQSVVGRLTGNRAAQEAEVDTAITGRATSMLAALRVTADYPILGVGPGNFPLYNRQYSRVGGFRLQEEDREAHCLYLHLSAEFGLIGLGVFMLMVGNAMVDLRRIWKKLLQSDREMAGIAAGLFLALLSYLLTGIFLHFSFIRFFWLILALACCVPLVVAREGLSGPRKPMEASA